MFSIEDAKEFRETIQSLDKFLADANVDEKNVDRVKYAVWLDKINSFIESPQIDAFTVEEIKQLRILLTAVMAYIPVPIKINIDQYIQEVNSSPEAYRVEINPDQNGSVLTIKFTGTAIKTLDNSHSNPGQSHAAKIFGISARTNP